MPVGSVVCTLPVSEESVLAVWSKVVSCSDTRRIGRSGNRVNPVKGRILLGGVAWPPGKLTYVAELSWQRSQWVCPLRDTVYPHGQRAGA